MKTPRVNLSDREWFYRYVKKEPWTPLQNHGYYSNNMTIQHPFKNQINAYEYLLKNQDLKNKNILEIGCGLGSGIHYINKKFNLDVLGIDIEPQFIKYARDNFKGRFIYEDFLKPTLLETKTMDIVISLCSFHFFKELNTFYIHLKDILKDKGKFIVSDLFKKQTEHIYIKLMEEHGFELEYKENITKETIKSMEYDINTLQKRFNVVSKEAVESLLQIQKHRHFEFKIRNEEQYQMSFVKK